MEDLLLAVELCMLIKYQQLHLLWSRYFTEKDDSPHLIADKIKGELYLAFAEKDKWVPKATLSKIKKDFSKYKKCSIEVYPSTEHGFAFPERNTYVKKAAEKHWEKLIHLFEKNLKKK